MSTTTVYIQTKSGPGWYTHGTIEAVRSALRGDELISIWWFAPWGQRYAEKIWLSEDEVAFIRTESEDG